MFIWSYGCALIEYSTFSLFSDLNTNVHPSITEQSIDIVYSLIGLQGKTNFNDSINIYLSFVLKIGVILK